MRDIADESARVLRQVRSNALGLDDNGLAAALAGAFRQAQLDTDTLMLRLASQPVAKLARTR